MNAVPEVLPRTGYRRRHTREIVLEATIDLDRSEPIVVATDIGFLNHLIAQLARQAGFALWLDCEAGSRADARLIVEDCALELGAALAEAVRGSPRESRYEAVASVEDTRAVAIVDFSAPPGAFVECEFGQQVVGGLPLPLVPVFFQALGKALGARIEIRLRGSAPVHLVAAGFRSVGVAIRDAIA